MSEALTLRVGRAILDLAALPERNRRGGAPSSLPHIQGPTERPSLHTALLPALATLLGRIDEGHLHLSLPLPPRRIGPRLLHLDLTQGHRAELELVVRQGRILTAQTHGHITPPIALPLGIQLTGLRLDARGHLFAALRGMPDLNLTRWVPRFPRIPERLDALFEILLALQRRKPRPTGRPSLDVLTTLTLRARQLALRPGPPLSLGDAGSLDIGPESFIDLQIHRGHLEVSGLIAIHALSLTGPQSQLDGLRGRGHLHLDLDLRSRWLQLDLSSVEGVLPRAETRLSDGTHVHLEDTALSSASLHLESAPETAPSLTLRCPRLHATLAPSRLLFTIDGQPCPLDGQGRVGGEVVWSDTGLELDLGLDALELRLGNACARLAHLTLGWRGLEASGRGRLTGSTSEGWSLNGVLMAHAELETGVLELPRVHASLTPPSNAQLRITHLGLPRSGHLTLEASANVHLALERGSLPLASTRLVLDKASGQLELRSISINARSRWPELDAHLELRAHAEPLALHEHVVIPPSQASLTTQIAIRRDGQAELREMEVQLSSRACS